MAEIKVVATNQKAYHNYFISDPVEAGLVLTGTEIKSLRGGRVSLGDAYVKPENGEMWLLNAHIARYEPGSYMSHEPTRQRKLLVHKKQMRQMLCKIKERGLTLVPTKIYIKGNIAKVEVAVGKGKKLYDKREVIEKRECERELGRVLKNRL
ncbi:SsrA-binding protein SmpB [Dehalogenimonas etheniformans]|uniref:SsrA-binding protein n=1 Tax=Dehalogenimonas etheniformans TaxID=1536648 RepID=A0A2P5P869_9CHLR|nr:SsrA-binding protein SmpB [Dehalogenimonas etheniformans]PPD58475.1 SsrA-binding protein SmpB [Dehalogenimonas etheniformans]QNT76760.1 SsrA-binding protein SmpB [Dehalogenimonas etheniformans]